MARQGKLALAREPDEAEECPDCGNPWVDHHRGECPRNISEDHDEEIMFERIAHNDIAGKEMTWD